jgi:hypothetical protein
MVQIRGLSKSYHGADTQFTNHQRNNLTSVTWRGEERVPWRCTGEGFTMINRDQIEPVPWERDGELEFGSCSVKAEGHDDWEPDVVAARLKEKIKSEKKRRDWEKKRSDRRGGYLEVDGEPERKRGRTSFHSEVTSGWILIQKRGEVEGGKR